MENNKYYLDILNNICDKSKEYLMIESLKYFTHYEDITDIMDLTPIEQIFYICYKIYIQTYKMCKFDEIFENPFAHFDSLINKQVKADYKDNQYIIDFTIDFSRKNIYGHYIYPKYKNFKYAIELDGIEYHSNKEQINYDYKRENDLKLLGYNVIRFTGSQIYNNPNECIDKITDIILNDLEGVWNE